MHKQWQLKFGQIVMLLGLLCATENTVFAAESITLQLKWHHQFQFAGYYAALNQGYYSQENLDVRIVEGGTDASALNQVLSGEADYGIGDSDILLAHTQGQPVVAVASVFQHSPYVLLSLRSSKIQKPTDLIGKRIMLSNNQGATQFKAMMNKQGIDPGQVTLLPHSWDLRDLIDGKVDAMSAYATAEPARLEKMGYTFSILSNQQYGVDYYGDTLFTTAREVERHPERVDAFLRATKKGWTYAFSHQQEMAKLIAGMEGVAERGIIEEMLLEEARLMQPYVLSDVVEFGHMNLERWRAIANSMAALQLIPQDYVLDGFIYSSHVLEERVLRWIAGLLLLALMLVCLIFLWNLQIRRKVKDRTAELQEEVQRRRQAENLLKFAGSAAKLGGWIMDVKSGIVTWSDEVAAIHEMPAGHSPTVEEGMALFVPEHREKIKEAVQKCIEQGIAYDLELEKFTANGRRIWVRTIGQPVRDADGAITKLQGSFQDISERKRLEAFKVGQNKILEQIASNQPLMNIMHAAVALIEAQFPDCMCSTMLMDSDGRHLHVGASTKLPQAYLQCIDGIEISSQCGSCGTAAYEKRSVIVSDIEHDPLWAEYKSAALPFGLRACWSSPIFSSQKQVLGTFAMYKAKDSGRNAYRFFDPEMEAFLRERVMLESDLHQGIIKQQFILHYQPQLNSSRQIVGAEALMRWQHPQRGLVMPAQFIEFAEDCGLILSIGEWVLASACAQLLLWAQHPATQHLKLSVNVSPRQYLQSDFVEHVTRLIKDTGIDPTKLKLELTESILVDNVEEIISKMHALSAMGVGFSLDDFGTGYSSLSYLKRLPLSELKIDQSFVCDIFNDDKDSSIVHTIINLGQNLGLQVLAEGVETEQQLNFLLARGCQLFQGYLFSKPLPVKAFEALLIEKNHE